MIRVGTDCSGIEAPIQALRNLGIKHHHVFSSEIDQNCIDSIIANYEPDIIYKDIKRRRDIPDIDLYICGFPCQSFSHAGSRKGTNDKRGKIFWECLKVIKNKKPSVFILENVKGLLTIDEGKTFQTIIESLEDLKSYDIYHTVLNSKDYGIPQNRERVFIVGISKTINKGFIWPSKRKMKSLKNIIDNTDNEKHPSKRAKIMEKNVSKDALFIDLSFRNATYPNSNKYAPCLNTKGALWCVPKHRYANIKELLRLQGFPENFNQVVSDSEMKKQLGNSISVCVLEAIFEQIYNF